MQKFPDTALGLLLALEELVPEQCSSPKTNRDEDLHHGGKRELVRFIRTWFEKSRSGQPTVAKRPRR